MCSWFWKRLCVIQYRYDMSKQTITKVKDRLELFTLTAVFVVSIFALTPALWWSYHFVTWFYYSPHRPII